MAQEYRIYFKKVEEEGGDYLVESSHNMWVTTPKPHYFFPFLFVSGNVFLDLHLFIWLWNQQVFDEPKHGGC